MQANNHATHRILPHKLEALVLVSGCLIWLSCAGNAVIEKSNGGDMSLPMYSDWNVVYPIELSPEQETVLNELTKLLGGGEMPPGLEEQIRNNKLPALAGSADLEITDGCFKNISIRDVLIVVAHETGDDLAVRTHWLQPGEFVLRSTMGTNLISPGQKDH
jgi:hypothetical protein